MATTPNKLVTPQAMRAVHAIATAAKTTMNDAANAVLLAAASTNGSVLRRLAALPRATVTATQLHLWRSPDSGTTLYLVKTVLMPAYTVAQTTLNAETDFGYSDT